MSDITIEEVAETAHEADRYLAKELDKLQVRVLALEVIIQQLANAILAATDSVEEFEEEAHEHPASPS